MSTVNIQIPQGPVTDKNGNITLEWALFIQSLIAMGGGNSSFTINDLAVAQAFDTDNTSQVADLQRQISHLDTGQNPFSTDGNSQVTAVGARLTALENAQTFDPKSDYPKPEPLDVTFEKTSYVSPEVLDIPVPLSGFSPVATLPIMFVYAARHG